MSHLLRNILSLFVICIFSLNSVAGAAVCDMQSDNQAISDQQIMADCHNMDQTSDKEVPQKSDCDKCLHCMSFVHAEFQASDFVTIYQDHYRPMTTHFTTYSIPVESPPPKVS